MPLALGHERVRLGVGGQPQERDLVPVLREHGSHVGVDTRIEPADRVPADVEHPHVQVVPAAAHERHSPTVRRPAQTRDLAARLEECLGLGSPVERRNLSPALVYEGHAIPRRRHDRRVPLSELLRLASRDRHDPHSLLRSARIARRIRHLLPPVRSPAAHVDQPTPIGSELELPQLLPVLFVVGGETPPDPSRGFGHPDVPHPAVVHDPGDDRPARRRGEVGRERRPHDLLDGEQLGRCDGRPSTRQRLAIPTNRRVPMRAEDTRTATPLDPRRGRARSTWAYAPAPSVPS